MNYWPRSGIYTFNSDKIKCWKSKSATNMYMRLVLIKTIRISHVGEINTLHHILHWKYFRCETKHLNILLLKFHHSFGCIKIRPKSKFKWQAMYKLCIFVASDNIWKMLVCHPIWHTGLNKYNVPRKNDEMLRLCWNARI